MPGRWSCLTWPRSRDSGAPTSHDVSACGRCRVGESGRGATGSPTTTTTGGLATTPRCLRGLPRDPPGGLDRMRGGTPVVRPLPRAADAASARGGSAVVVLTSLESSVLADLNAVRAAHGLVPLRLNPSLAAAASSHCRQMVADGFFAHDSPNGLRFARRDRRVLRLRRLSLLVGRREPALVGGAARRRRGRGAVDVLAGASRQPPLSGLARDRRLRGRRRRRARGLPAPRRGGDRDRLRRAGASASTFSRAMSSSSGASGTSTGSRSASGRSGATSPRSSTGHRSPDGA